MAEYGRQPEDNYLQTSLLTGGAALVGLFALGAHLKPIINRKLMADAERAIVGDATEEGYTLLAHLRENGTPKVNTAQVLMQSFVQSRGMKVWTDVSRHVMPLQILDKLAFGPELREAYGTFKNETNQFQRLGELSKTGLLSQKELDEIGHDRVAYYVGGKVYHVGDPSGEHGFHDVKELPGTYFMYGKAGKGESRSAIENSIADLSGVSSQAENIANMRDAMVHKLGEDLELNNLGFHDLINKTLKATPELKEFRKRMRNIEKLDKVLYRHNSLDPINKFRRSLDIGLNERGAGLFTEEGREKLKETAFGLFNPADLPEERKVGGAEGLGTFGAVRNFSFSFKGVKDLLLGGKDGDINTGTLAAYKLFERVNTGVAWNGVAPWLAMSGKSTTFKAGPVEFNGPAAYITNLLTKRALPLYATAFYAGYLNDQIGQQAGVRPTDAAVLNVDQAQLAWAGIKDRLGISPTLKHLDDISGGVLNHLFHPFVDAKVGLSQDELKDQIENGRTAVRKGRWWTFGSSTPFRGERIQYYTPNMHQQALAGDVYKTDTFLGSTQEYYDNQALPTPTSLLAPLNHFLFDRYHYEEKHYKDRPYPLSAPLFEPTSLHGVLLNPILGPILKPTKVMHQDEMPYILDGPQRGQRNPRYQGDIKRINEEIKDRAANTPVEGYVTASGQIAPMQVVGLPRSTRILEDANQSTIEQGEDAEEGISEGEEQGSYTERGAGSIVPYGSGKVKNRQKLKELNADIKSGNRATRFGKGSMLEPSMAPGLFKQNDMNDPRALKNMISSYDPRYQAGLAYYSATEIGGIYGFGAVTATGDLYANLPTIQNAGRMTSFERTYWDRYNSGGMLPTPGLSELFRRFMPHRYHSNTEYNPIRNTMATWLPGQGGEDPAYFMDFLHGDPYVAIPNGEVRLPGASYEKLHGIPTADLSIRSTQVGYGEQAIYQFLTGTHPPFAAYSEEIAEQGSDIHKNVIRDLRNTKQVLATRAEYNYNGIKGSIDAITAGENGPEAVEIHTVSGKRYAELASGNNIKDERYERQLQIDMGAIQAKSASLIYVNRDDPKQQTVQSRQYDPHQEQMVLRDVNNARAKIQQGISQGQFSTGQFYDDVTRLEILGDVAPWSTQYRRYRDYLVHLPDDALSEQDRARIKAVKTEVTQRKKRFQFSPYKIKYGDLQYETIHVKNVIDANTFTTLEHPDNPIRLAGVHINVDNADFASQFIKPGASLRVGFAADQTQRIAKDTLHTIRSVVYFGNTQINKAAIEAGAGTEKPDDSPAGLRVRYTDQELAIGGVLEKFGHMPINLEGFHNKYMAIDSPLELYKRTQVYGKDWQDWRHPFRDYLFPAYESFSTQGLAGAFGAGILGYFLGTGKAWEKGGPGMRLKLAMGSVLLEQAVSIWRGGEKNPIPSYRQKERSINEYFDILKYMKFEGLYEKTRSYVLKHEHKDIGATIDHYKTEGDNRKKRIQSLKEEKRRIIVSGHKKKDKKRLLEINKEIGALSAYRKELALTQDDVLAIQYKQVADSTLYGADSHGDLRKVLMALNPKEREFFNAFTKAKGPERAEILKLVPHNEKRFLQAAFGLHPDEKPDLVNYFKDHFLPPPDWTGWKAESSLNDYKLVVMKQEGMDMTAAGFWPQDEERVSEQNTPDIMPYRETSGDVVNRMRATMAGLGLKDVDIQVQANNQSNNQINLRVMREQAQQNRNLLAQ